MLGLRPLFSGPWPCNTGAVIGATLGEFKTVQASSTLANVFFMCWKMQLVISAAVSLKHLAGITRCLSKSAGWGAECFTSITITANLSKCSDPLSKAYLRDYSVYRKVITNFSELCSSLTLLPSSQGIAQHLWASWHHPPFQQVLLWIASHQTSIQVCCSASRIIQTCPFSQFLCLDAAADTGCRLSENKSRSLFFSCMGMIVIGERWSYSLL